MGDCLVGNCHGGLLSVAYCLVRECPADLRDLISSPYIDNFIIWRLIRKEPIEFWRQSSKTIFLVGNAFIYVRN